LKLNKTFSIFFIIIFFLVNPLLADKLPEYKSYFNDYTNFYDQTYVQVYNNLLTNISNTKKMTLVFAIVSDYAGEGSIESYAVELFEKWKIGDKEKDNGMLVVLNSKTREIKIEVGYGLEGDFPDGYVGELLDRFIYYYKQQGKEKATLALIAMIAEKEKIKLDYRQARNNANPKAAKRNPIVMIIMFVIFIIIFIRNPLLAMYLMSSFFARGASGSFSGGLGGFGGGSSGGGGASRRF